MKRASLILMIPVLTILTGCQTAQEAVSWVFFPNETATRARWEAEQAKDNEARELLVKESEAVIADQRSRVEDIATRRVDMDAEHQKQVVNYSAETAKLDIEEASVVTMTTQAVAGVSAKLDALDASVAEKHTAYKNKLASAQATDNALAAAVFGVLGLGGGWGLVASRAGGKIRQAVAEARDEEGRIGREEGVGVVYSSIEAIKESSPEFREAWDNNPQWGATAHKVIEAAGAQYVDMMTQKKMAKRYQATNG